MLTASLPLSLPLGTVTVELGLILSSRVFIKRAGSAPGGLVRERTVTLTRGSPEARLGEKVRELRCVPARTCFTESPLRVRRRVLA